MDSTAIIAAAMIIAVAIVWYNYHTDLRNIAYQLSRIANKLSELNREEGEQ